MYELQNCAWFVNDKVVSKDIDLNPIDNTIKVEEKISAEDQEMLDESLDEVSNLLSELLNTVSESVKDCTKNMESK